MTVRFFYAHDVHVNPTYGHRQIAMRLVDHLRKRHGDVEFGDFQDENYDPARVGADDIVIGHPGWAMERIRQAGPHKRTLLIVPIPPWVELSSMAERYRHLFFIGGRQWFEDLCEANRERLPNFDCMSWYHMCVDMDIFRRIKRRYSPPGKRQFLYVGRFDQARKNILRLVEVFSGLPDKLFIVSPSLMADATPEEVAMRDALAAGKYPNIQLVPFRLNVSPDFRDIVRECDFYIHMATFDSQATSILESAAYGLVPVLTRESGFEFSFGGFLDATDIDGCRSRIRELQSVPAQELEGASEATRRRLATHHSWPGICRALDRAVDRLLMEYPIAS